MKVDESLIGDILETARGRIESEAGDLLGTPLILTSPKLATLSGAGYLAQRKNLILTRVTAGGEIEGEIYICTPRRDAILMAGTLVMLPPSELQERVKKETFGEEETDAFGEIANIITGALNGVFEELYPKKCHLKKTGLQPIAAGKGGSAGESLAELDYLVGSFGMRFDDQGLGPLEILLPSVLFASEAQAVEAAEPSLPPVAPSVSAPLSNTPAQAPASPPLAPPVRPLVVIVSEPECEVQELMATLQESSFAITCLGFQDDVRDVARQQGVRGAFLVMTQVSEQGLAMAIKLRSNLPAHAMLIAAAPQWTRNTVLQAVKFGIRDILVTPASREEMQTKIASLRQAAH